MNITGVVEGGKVMPLANESGELLQTAGIFFYPAGNKVNVRMC